MRQNKGINLWGKKASTESGVRSGATTSKEGRRGSEDQEKSKHEMAPSTKEGDQPYPEGEKGIQSSQGNKLHRKNEGFSSRGSSFQK